MVNKNSSDFATWWYLSTFTFLQTATGFICLVVVEKKTLFNPVHM